MERCSGPTRWAGLGTCEEFHGSLGSKNGGPPNMAGFAMAELECFSKTVDFHGLSLLIMAN